MFAPWKLKTFLKVTHFIIGTDHRSLEGCLNKSILSFEKVDLRNLVAKISNFQIEYVPGESNVFRDWLSRK